MAGDTAMLISKSLLSSIQRVCQQDGHVGYLHNFLVGSNKHLVSCSTITDGDESGHIYDSVKRSLPAGIGVCGVYFVTEDPSDQASIEKKCKTQLREVIENLSDQSQVLLLAVSSHGTTDSMYLYEYNTENGYFINVPFSCEDDILSSCMLLRLHGHIPLDREHSKNKEKMMNDLMTEVDYWKEELRCPTTAFHVKNSDLVLFYSEEATGNNYSCRDILGHIQKDDEDEYDRKKKLKLNDLSKEIIHLSLLCQRTGDVACRLSMSCAPIIRHNHGSFTQLGLGLPIDVVAYVHPDTLSDYLTYILVEAVCDQLDALCHTIITCPDGELHTPVPYHFKPLSLGHIITLTYTQEDLSQSYDSELSEQRKQHHTIYNLPENIPQVKRLNAFIFSDEQSPGGCLINPHVGLSKSGVSGGCVSTVWGRYAYHHYMQDRIDDNGWGCAYRSLQTLVSWFRLQGYTNKPVPSHKEIQQALVDIGDKEKKFVGTKQWIGSTEVNYVLDHLLGVTSKILYVNSGAELESKGRELAIHFDTQGTPVMIGGGVLAHTILGVDFNEITGDVKFLILDPHYTGGEDLKLIQDKGWCGWKGPDFWDKNAYYNMCMPQRPLIF